MTSPSQNIPYSMRLKMLEGRAMAAAKAAKANMFEFSGTNYQASTRITRLIGQASDSVQTATNPRYRATNCCTEAAPAIAPSPCDLPGDITLIGISDTYLPSPPYDISYNMAFDVSWQPVVNATSYGIRMTYDSGMPMSDYYIVNRTVIDVTIYTQQLYTNISLTIMAINDCGMSTLITDGINPAP
jgi:hypothetical protein